MPYKQQIAENHFYESQKKLSTLVSDDIASLKQNAFKQLENIDLSILDKPELIDELYDKMQQDFDESQKDNGLNESDILRQI